MKERFAKNPAEAATRNIATKRFIGLLSGLDRSLFSSTAG
jgi:hypothetical protein